MSEISHYHSLDERLEEGPPLDALCDKCTSLKLLDLFSGPRYGEWFEGYERPFLDRLMGTVAEVRASGRECRFCFLVSAFHDARHSDPTSPDQTSTYCKGDLEICILKPYRTDIALMMYDNSDCSDKESIATSIIMCFELFDEIQRRRSRAAAHDPHNALRPKKGRSRTKKVFGRISQYIGLDTDSKRTDSGTEVDVVDAHHLDHERCNSDSSIDTRVQDDCFSVAGIQARDFQHIRLPTEPYQYHWCMFCLTDASFIGRRHTLSFSRTAQGPRIDWQSLRGWVEHCEKYHPGCRPKDTDLVAQENLRIRCIDVKSSTIVELVITAETRYLALSYVWGAAHSDLTGDIRQCLAGENSTILTESLPLTIRDAIRITEQMGEQYLWIDSLCLDQTTIATEIGLMDRIYENAVLTIIAATSKNVYSGIPGLRTHSRLRSVSEVSVDGRTIKAVCVRTYDEFVGDWMRRGWTFQEWVLSRRCLFFSDNLILFRCQELSGPESFQPPRRTPLSKNADIPQFWADRRSCNMTILPRLSLDSPVWNFQTYAYLVREYTTRRLTYESDILRAFTGIMRKLERSTGMAFVEAMPTGDILKALLWTQGPRLPRAKIRRSHGPSWTWAESSFRALYMCWELEESCETLYTQGDTDTKSYMQATPHTKRMARWRCQSAKESNISVILGACFGYESLFKPRLYSAYRLRRADPVFLLSAEDANRNNALRIISETRSVLVHQNPKTRLNSSLTSSIDPSTDDLLNPVTNEVIAGQNFLRGDDGHESRHLLCFNFIIAVSEEESFSSHDAVLLYEWDICGQEGKYYRKVVAMLFDRLPDGTVERLALVSVRSKDWSKLPLVNEREELTMV